MNGVVAMWGDVISRLGLLPTGPIEDGLRYVLQASSAEVEVLIRSLRQPPSARVVVRPHRSDGSWLVAAPALSPSPSRWRTGDAEFDDRVAVLAGGRVLLPRLGKAERERLAELVARGAIVGSEEATLEPAVLATFTDPKDLVTAIRDLVRAAARLAVDPPIEELVDRWGEDERAPMVEAAVQRRVVELLPSITEVQAETVCRMLVERGADAAMPMLPLMPPFPCVLSAWFKVGDPLDQRVTARVVDAWASGNPRPAARYLAWLLHQPELQAALAAEKLAHTPGILDDPGFVREFVRAVRKEPPANALPLLLKIKPRSSSITRRLARALSCYASPEVDRRLLEWLTSGSSGVRAAAATALADRVVAELGSGGSSPSRPADLDGRAVDGRAVDGPGRHRSEVVPAALSSTERLETLRRAAERSSELMQALLERVSSAHTAWLATVRPHGEPDAVALIRRLGLGGADVDEALLFWLDRGTLPVRLEAAHALGAAGSAKVLTSLRDRAGSWFSDGGVREACKAAADQIRDRVGGAGSLALAGPAAGELALVEAVQQADEPSN